jgi:hypothetical protein
MTDKVTCIDCHLLTVRDAVSLFMNGSDYYVTFNLDTEEPQSCSNLTATLKFLTKEMTENKLFVWDKFIPEVTSHKRCAIRVNYK